MTLIISILIFVLSIIALVKGADWFTDAAKSLSLRFRISPYIIGVTVVSIGTSLPELASSIVAVIKGDGAIVLGNVIGSNIANIFLVLGAGSLVAGTLRTKWNLRKVDFPLLFAATFLLWLMVWNGSFSIFDALFMLLGLAVYLHYLFKKHESGEFEEELSEPKKGETLFRHIILPFFFGLLLIVVGAKYTVDSVIAIARLTEISTGAIASTAVALGTSLPELFVTVMASLKGNYEIAIGNVMGSNLFNIFGILGISGLFGSIFFPTSMISFSMPVLVGATFMFYLVTSDRNISRWEGAMLLILYCFFVIRVLA